MKRLNLMLFGLASFFCFQAMEANAANENTTKTEYRPFVEDNKQWVVVSADYRIHYTKIYYIERDTIVCNQPCKRLMLHYKNYRDGTDATSLYCCIFEEDAKVFYFPTDAVLPASPIMLYDFKATVGDIISLGGLPDDSHKETYYQVWQDMQQEINGENFHALLATEYNPSITYADEESVLPLYKWYEGIGSRIHPFEKRFWNRKMGGMGEFLYECRVKDRVIYSDSHGVAWEPVTFTKDQMATIILPSAPDASKGKYYRLDRVEGKEIVFEQEFQPRAHVPYIIVPSEDFSIDISSLDLEGLQSDTVSIEGIHFIGVYSSKELPAPAGGDGGGSFYYDIIDTTPDCGFSPSGETGKSAFIGALRAYLLVNWDDPINHPGSKDPGEKMPIVLKDNGTSLSSLTPTLSQGEGDEMVNGKSSNGKCYDLQGRRLNTLPLKGAGGSLKGAGGSGVYIRDGKKLLVK